VQAFTKRSQFRAGALDLFSLSDAGQADRDLQNEPNTRSGERICGRKTDPNSSRPGSILAPVADRSGPRCGKPPHFESDGVVTRGAIGSKSEISYCEGHHYPIEQQWASGLGFVANASEGRALDAQERIELLKRTRLAAGNTLLIASVH
jgi:hypothetical protein